MNSLLQDIRYGFRMLLKDRWATVFSVLALAIGIGLCTTQFTIINGIVLKGLPFEGSERLYLFEWKLKEREGASVELRIHDFHYLREQQTSFEGLAAFYSDEFAVTNPANDAFLKRYSGAFISANFLDLIHVQPLLGRGFAEGEDRPGAEPVVLIGYDVWQRDYGAAPDIVGTTIFFEGETRIIVGVMPQDFKFPILHEVWAPLKINHLEIAREVGPRLSVFGLLKEGTSFEEAEAEYAVIAQRLKQEYDESMEGYDSFKIRLFHDIMDDRSKAILLVMLQAVLFVLLIACANVSSVLLARASLRGKELAIRNALGASRRRLILQMLTESLLMTSLGAVGGVLISLWGSDVAWHYFELMKPPFWIAFDLDLRVLGFVVGLTVVASLVSGLVPALKSTRIDVNEMLKDNPRTASSLHMGRFTRILVVGQLSLCCSLLVISILFVEGMFRLFAMELPFEPNTVLATRLVMEEKDFPEEADSYAFCTELFDRLRGVSGIEHVAAAGQHRMDGTRMGNVAIEGQSYPTEDDYAFAFWDVVSTDYFETLGVPLLKGRAFAETDTTGSLPVALVNPVFAEQHWPEDDPLGRRFRNTSAEGNPWLTVVGLVPDLQMEGMVVIEGYGGGYYVPMSQNPQRAVTLLLRGRGDLMAWPTVVHRAVFDLSPGLSIRAFMTLQEGIDEIRAGLIFSLVSFEIFGFVALFLASVGVYGVISFSVNQRIHEIGIRMAMGAQARDILWIIMKQGLIQLAIGLTVGLGMGYALLRALDYLTTADGGIPYNIPHVYVIVALILTAVALLATWAPARRASKVYPMMALRHE